MITGGPNQIVKTTLPCLKIYFQTDVCKSTIDPIKQWRSKRVQKQKSDEQTELIALALLGIDARIAELERKRAELVNQIAKRTIAIKVPKVKAAVPASNPRKRSKFSAAHRAKLKAAAKKRWAERKAAEK